MALKLYSEAAPGYEFTSSNPFRVTFDGRIGGAIDTQIFLRNDDPDRWYENIKIQAIDNDGLGRANGASAGYFIKFAESDIPLPIEAWELVGAGNQLSLGSNLGSTAGGDIVTYLSIWVRVSVPTELPIQTIKNIVFQISATESIV